jgi:ferritin-like metal-binding protein YciE
MLKDIYYAEKKLTKALGKMAKKATNTQLKEAFTTHQQQTDEQIEKLEEAFEMLGMTPKAKKCAAMDGLLEEGNEHMEEYEKGAGLDAALIVGAQKVEHYEIAAYGSMRTFAKTLGYNECAALFEEIREQESDTDELLTTIAESVVNLQAEEETKDVEGGGQSSGGNGGTNGRSNGRGSEDSEAGEDSSSAVSSREGGDEALAGAYNGDDRNGNSETGSAMGY